MIFLDLAPVGVRNIVMSRDEIVTSSRERVAIKLRKLYILNAVRCPSVCRYVRNGGRGELSSE